jgi:hypothetical protein
MSAEESPGCWEPDNALVFAVRGRSVPIKGMSDMDRAWIVAALTVDGWTVSAIAGRLDCSLRLVQQIKAEPITKVALYAIKLQREVTSCRSLRNLESRTAAQEIASRDDRIEKLITQRDRLLDQLVTMRKERSNARGFTADCVR